MATAAKLSLKEYERIVASGVFDWPKKRHIELIRGHLREQGPIAPDHAEVVCRLNEWSFRHVLDRAIRIRVQNPLAFATSIASQRQILPGFERRTIPTRIQPPPMCCW